MSKEGHPLLTGDDKGISTSAHIKSLERRAGEASGSETAVTDAQDVLAVLSASLSESPWPSAAVLHEYASLDPSFPRELIAEFKAESALRRELERTRTLGSEARQDRAQTYAAGLAIAGMVLAGGFHLLGGSVYLSIAIVVLAIGGPSTATVLARLADKWK